MVGGGVLLEVRRISRNLLRGHLYIKSAKEREL